MTWLMESPATIIAAVVLTEFILAGVLFRSGQARVFGAMFLVAILGLGLLFAERMVVTDREAIRSTLDVAAHSLMTNDPAKVLAYVDPEAIPLKERIRAAFREMVFKEARVGGDYEVTLHNETSPPTAIATFLARARVQEKRGSGFGREEVARRVVVELKKIEGRWLIHDAHEADRPF